MITLQPQQDFVVIWENDDPADTTTYYPQAVIRDAITGDTIDTVDLSLVAGSTSLYQATWHVCADVSGAGRQINLTLKTYTDSGHTTISQTKTIENRDYIVMDRLRHIGGGGGVDVDYKRIAKLIAEELDKRPYPTVVIPEFPEFPEFPVYDQAPLLLVLERISQDLKAIVIPEQKETDLSPVLNALERHMKEMMSLMKDMPRMENHKSGLSLMEKIKNLLTVEVAAVKKGVASPIEPEPRKVRTLPVHLIRGEDLPTRGRDARDFMA